MSDNKSKLKEKQFSQIPVSIVAIGGSAGAFPQRKLLLNCKDWARIQSFSDLES
jgi:hypothetical protein